MSKPKSPRRRPQVAPSSRLTKLRLALLYSFPVALFCSYYPVIPIARSANTNYELSLALVWLFIFSILSLKDTLRYIYNIYSNFKAQKSLKAALPFTLLLFPLYLSLSVLWSTNPLRAVLTAGILWCLLISAIGVITLSRNTLFSKHHLLKLFLLTSCVFAGICWLQSVLDLFAVDRETTLLCLGCTSFSFGFPHPSGLAIEPQFMGNLLLAPALLAIYLWIKSLSQKTVFDSKSLLAIAFFLTSTLFLTFSRGAIYSFIIALIIMIIIKLAKLKRRAWLKTIPLVTISFIFTLCMQGLFSAASFTNSTFLSGIKNSLSQLSLGQITFQSAPAETPAETTATTENASQSVSIADDAPVFDGYVEESTNVRMNFNRLALELSTSSPARLLFGYGLGSAGETLCQAGKTSSPLEIIQNEYLSLLLETGVVGVFLAALALLAIYLRIKRFAAPERYLLASLTVGFLFSLLFFSGLPNALHLYLFPVFIAAGFTLPPSSFAYSRQTRTYHKPRN